MDEKGWEKICDSDRLALEPSMLIKEQNAKRKSLTALNLYDVIALISINLTIYTVKTMQCSFTFDYF